jgi:feruloyl esterase
MRRRRVMLAAGSAAAVAAVMAVVATAAPLAPALAAPSVTAAQCQALGAVMLAETTIESAAVVAGPTFTPPGGGALARLPEFCRVVAVTKPAVRFEVWLPLTTWNGKFQGVGNGGTAGIISYAALATGIRAGYATASTDTGHVSKDSADSSWALGRPDLVADFGHRGLHVMTENGKRLTAALYQSPPARSYYVGCSKGGQQGLMEAQRYPADYDGIVAGAPAQNATRSYLAGHLWAALATERDPESYIPAPKIAVLSRAVTAACDANDGVTDGVIDDPRRCQFDPASLVCKAGQDPASCFTPKQATAVKQIYAGAVDSKGQRLYPGYMPGAESGSGGTWERYVTGNGPLSARHLQLADGFLKYVVFGDPKYDFRSFNYDRDLPAALAKLSPLIDAMDPDLRPLRQRGAKLLVYHGWNDPSIPVLNSIDYYESVVSTINPGMNRQAALAATQAFYRMFLVPGMQHCSGGPGTDNFDMLAALENWVEKGIAPDSIVATHRTDGRVDRSRPLCPYPQVAVYSGTGSTADAANFKCQLAR